MKVQIERVFAETPDIRALIGVLDAELGAHYTPEQRHGISLKALFEPPVRFFVARTEDGAQGCGGVALLDDFAELKRMYVREDARGSGVADALVRQLTLEAAGGRIETAAAGNRLRATPGDELLPAARICGLRGV